MFSKASRAIQNMRDKDYSFLSCSSCGLLGKARRAGSNYFRSTSNKSSKRSTLLSRSRSGTRATRSASSEENLWSSGGNNRKRRSKSASDKDRYVFGDRADVYNVNRRTKGEVVVEGGGNVGSRRNIMVGSNNNLVEVQVPRPSRRKDRASNQADKTRKEVEGLWLEQQLKSGRETLISDSSHQIVYRRGRLLGKGGFAKCYKLTDKQSGSIYAGKVISRGILSNPREKEKILREIELHRSLKHKNVVAFQSFFEDNENVYIVLEYCSQKSLDEIVRRRRFITEPEVRYYMRQLIEGCCYIHSQLIVHRDLKLGNMLLTDQMRLKIADFGLATRVAYIGEKKMTVCGTPNYIAPEVLQQKGHSYAADIWALGCVMYAMLCGRPPFETTTLKETYRRITTNDYVIPFVISEPASNLIRRFLNASPWQRPPLTNLISSDPFFTYGYTPKKLSTDCCRSEPNFKSIDSSDGAALVRSKVTKSVPKSLNVISDETETPKKQHNYSSLEPVSSLYLTCDDNMIHNSSLLPAEESTVSSVIVPDLDSMCRLFTSSVHKLSSGSNPEGCPVINYIPVCVSKWVDYCNKYGFGYELSDGSVGILFNDKSSMLLKGYRMVTYVTTGGQQLIFCVEECTSGDMKKKLALLLGFAEYMDNNLISGGVIATPGGEVRSHAPTFIRFWFRTSKAIVMFLQSGTIQINFWNDHTKIILSAYQEDENCKYFVTFVNSKRSAVTRNLRDICQHGVSIELAERISYATKMLNKVTKLQNVGS